MEHLWNTNLDSGKKIVTGLEQSKNWLTVTYKTPINNQISLKNLKEYINEIIDR